jgi:DNA-binding response OmpR family regulator
MQETRKTHVLIIDDDPVYREVLRVMLSAEGYALEMAEDAVDGGKALLAQQPDLIICDVEMPYMDGLELLSLLRSHDSTRSLPVIFVSGRSDIDILGRAAQLGASDYLVKPLTRERLLESVKTCLMKTKGDGIGIAP